MPTVNEELFDASVRHQIGLLRLGNKTIRELSDLLGETLNDITFKLNKKDLTDFSRKRLKALLENLRATNKEAYKILNNRLKEELKELAIYEADFQARLIEEAMPVSIAVARPTVETLSAIVREKPLRGRLLKDAVGDISEGNIRRIEQAIRIGMLEGETTPQIIRRIRGTRASRFTDGIIHLAKRDSEMLVRTSINHITARARDALYTNNQNLVNKWRFTATLDNRTTVICASLDGQQFDVGTGPMPPRHPNCRSTTTPIIKSWREIGIDIDEAPEGTRAALDGQVPETLTYQAWLKQQAAKKGGRKIVEEILGKTKAKLFLDGELPLNKFVEFTNREFTLTELRSREADIFTSLNI